MKEKIQKKLIYEALGFPIVLLNAPMKEIIGELILDINLNQLQKNVLRALAFKPWLLTGKELRFIRKYFELTFAQFGKKFGVSHPAVIKWENDKAKINPATESSIRLFILDSLKAKDDEFRSLYHEISVENLAGFHKSITKSRPIKLDANSF